MRAMFVLLSFALFFATSIVAGAGVTTVGSSDPIITFINTAGRVEEYQIQGNSDNPGTAYGAGKSPLPPLTVAAGETIDFYPGAGFVGAFTAKGGAGTRLEVNFRGYPTWYNADMEYGMSNVTLGPTDGSKRIDGGDSLAGEQDCLGKSNAAWADVDEGAKVALLETGYLNGTSTGNLTAVSMGAGAPLNVVEFYQMTAEFNAYVCAGSVAGQTTDDMEAAADQFSYSVDTNKMTVTSY